MLKINDKTFMNIQEAVQWLLDNNALPFQSTANYAGNTEIGLGTIVNPSPAKVRVGSLVFFADSKVSTVIAVTSNSFICSDQYNNLVDDIPYVTNVAINASGHLITTLSNGLTIDAGIVKQVTGFSINGSQHLIVSFNDGTSTDLGAIFSGNITISGNLTVAGTATVAGDASANNFTANSIIENMLYYTFEDANPKTNLTRVNVYAGVVKTGNKITFAWSGSLTRTGDVDNNYAVICSFGIPSSVGQKIYPNANYGVGLGSIVSIHATFGYENYYSDGVPINAIIRKNNDASLSLLVSRLSNLTLNTLYSFRIEVTYLLSENLAS